ncbi:hypothetical protein COT42_06595 [Candidatus Saganbacteria bacterium CG08_land_8_20_14_0_20_45_16]|uniref:Transposase n=1 Tax=Candidatus Saganbacteria bacterium CG08_land_8_20_14_0_20_45_16 TaxID=2014293 RepID=A0A2H0XVH4_UNCSA|nr:MAG: hypothetical protein COT42_06595 [Candidatus Saganbacteria bacterium CG08_land_8_20_14_0_20_45_16]
MLFEPEKLARLNLKTKKANQAAKEKEDDYKVNLKNLKEEQRLVQGIPDVYGKLFDDLGYRQAFKNLARQVATVETFKNVVLARVANPQSKRASVDMLEETFGIFINLQSVYKMMDKLKNVIPVFKRYQNHQPQ